MPLYWSFKRKINMEEDRKIKIHGVYRHFKGKFYIVEDIAFHSETKEEYVVYRQLHSRNLPSVHRITDADKPFLQPVEKPFAVKCRNIHLPRHAENQNVIIACRRGGGKVEKSEN